MLHENGASLFDCAVCGATSVADVSFYGVRECEHRLCGICSIKLAVFSREEGSEYDYSKCVICKDSGTKIIISSTMKQFGQFNENDLIDMPKYGLFLDGTKALKFYKDLMKIECHACYHQFVSAADLVDHVGIHNIRYCELCVQFKKCLPSEFLSMTDNDFHYHNTKEHPKCNFCNKRFYDNSHLIKHVKDCHFLCDICNRRQGFVAYSTQDELLKHFLNDHHMCDTCRCNNMINVFESEYALKTHKVLEHDNKGLVAEGLVNVNYGDSNLRYGPRRRVREMDDPFVSESPNIVNQDIPEISCEEAFPRLNSEQVPQNRQLGAMSVSNDENDARRAFNKPNDQHEQNKSKTGNNKDISVNATYCAKRNLANFSVNDFPSLLNDTRASCDQGIEYNKIKNGNTFKTINKQQHLEEEYPALSSRNIPLTPATPTWKPIVNTKSKHINQKPSQSGKNICKVRDPSPPEVNMEIEREIASKPKIQIMNRDDFEQNNTKKEITVIQRPLLDADFPTLGNNNKGRAVPTAGTWCHSNIKADKPNIKAETLKQEKFTANSPLDFPELPFKSKPVENSAVKQKNKEKKNKNFSDVTSSNINVTKSKVYPLKSNGEQFNKEVINKQSDQIYEKPQPSSSMRGLDYVPYVVPTNENVVLVDSKQFSDLKNSKVNNTKNGGFVLTDVSECVSLSSSSNHFDAFINTDELPAGDHKHKSRVTQKKFKTSSYSDFPELPQSNKAADKMKAIPIFGKKDNFADIAASSGTNGYTKVYSLKALSEQFQKPVIKMDFETTVPVYSPVPSASLRGIDYVPYIEPRNENVVLVDSKKFSELRNPKDLTASHFDSSSVQKTICNKMNDNVPFDNTSEFPDLPLLTKSIDNKKIHRDNINIKTEKNDNAAYKVAAVSEINSQPGSDSFKKSEPSSRDIDFVPCGEPRNETVTLVNTQNYSDLKKCNLQSEIIDFSQDSLSEVHVRNVPKLSSNTDFPSLDSPKDTCNNKPQLQIKKETPIQRAAVTNTSVISLMDVALSVTNKTYTPYFNADERNQRLFDVVNEAFDSNLALSFLSLSGSYRNRKITVQDYLDCIKVTFVDHLAFIAEVLPLMLVLLPDISLQKCLLSHMPQEWAHGLKECNKCGQIITRTDTDDHNLSAHASSL